MNGLIIGEWISYYENGGIAQKGYYENGFMDREWTFYYENGNIKGIGHYINGDGSDDGNTGIPRHNREGEWNFYHEDGEIYEKQNWANGQMAGDYITYHNGIIESKGNYKDGGRDGKWIWYYENGIIESEGNYKDDVSDGKWISYYEEGNIEWLYYFENGKRTGTTTQFYENGNIQNEGIVLTLENGKNGWDGLVATYYESGKIQVEENWKDGIKNGFHKGYYEEGNIEWLYYFAKDGKRDESKKTTRFHQNGNVWYEGTVITLENGETAWHDIYKSYDERGRLMETIKYNRGQRIN